MSDEEFAERVTAMTQTLYRVCYAQLSQACDREDAVQEALRKCWQKRGQLRDARYLQTWVIRVLLNECHNIQRRAARLQPCATLPERAAAPQPMGTTRVGEALLGLEEKLRMPLVLHYMEGYSVAGRRRGAAHPAGHRQDPPAPGARGAQGPADPTHRRCVP